jgi:hypothetical protein
MDTTEAIILSQIPIGIGVILVAYELWRLRKGLEKAMAEAKKK